MSSRGPAVGCVAAPRCGPPEPRPEQVVFRVSPQYLVVGPCATVSSCVSFFASPRVPVPFLTYSPLSNRGSMLRAAHSPLGSLLQPVWEVTASYILPLYVSSGISDYCIDSSKGLGELPHSSRGLCLAPSRTISPEDKEKTKS